MSIFTTLNHYRFDLTKPADAAAYAELRANVLDNIGFPCWTMQANFDCYSMSKPVYDFMDKVRAHTGQSLELETNCLFANQWNAANPSLRVFNWSEAVYANRHIREGYWLTQTDEMRAVLRDTLKCGYCGKMEPRAPSTPVFCPHCIDSEYLTLELLHLTRLVPVCDTDKKRAPLSADERATLEPIFTRAQIEGATARGKARIAKARASVAAEYEKSVSDAKEKRDAAVWIMDNAPGILANWIFYDHTGVHSFGWRKKLSDGEVSALLDVISEFPFGYRIECADGRTLERAP